MIVGGNTRILDETVRRQKAGESVGLASICSANRMVIRAGLQQAAAQNTPILIEATCNQVNQFGGYTGSTPQDFADMVRKLAAETGCAAEHVLLGGDHLGPYPWRGEPAAAAMTKAADMVRAFVHAGFAKVHLDASMACADDEAAAGLPVEVVAERAAVLCAAAEKARQVEPSLPEPVYVIGTEVPAPGGALEDGARPSVTDPQDVAAQLAEFRGAFKKHDLSEAWQRVRAVVVQPGVEFGDERVHEYDPVAAAPLADFIRGDKALVYEAHSTDYQPAAALRAMVQDQFAILKVGPALTFAFREAVFALARMEQEWLGRRKDVRTSGIVDELEVAMIRNPVHWRDYYRGTTEQTAHARIFSRLDRVRYYWNVPQVDYALECLLENLERHPVPNTLLSQYMPVQEHRVRAGALVSRPRDLITDHVLDVLKDYAAACKPAAASDWELT